MTIVEHLAPGPDAGPTDPTEEETRLLFRQARRRRRRRWLVSGTMVVVLSVVAALVLVPKGRSGLSRPQAGRVGGSPGAPSPRPNAPRSTLRSPDALAVASDGSVVIDSRGADQI